MVSVLISIKPKCVEQILSGRKHYEFRKSIYKRTDIDRIYIYSSSPVKKVVAAFHPKMVVSDRPDVLWEKFRDVSGVSEKEFFEYFQGRDTGYAIMIDELEAFEMPVDPKERMPGFVAPQSYMYVGDRLAESV